MKEFKGTKGEWYVDHEENGYNEHNVLYTPISSDSADSLVTSICEVYGDSDEDKANAKLIASAPELLEALQQMQIDLNILQSNFRQIEKVDSRADGMVQVVQNWIDRNNKAINKALGDD